MTEPVTAPQPTDVSPPPTAAPPPQRTLGRLALPPRGNRSAALYERLGLLFYLVAGLTLFGILIVEEEDSRTAAILSLLGLGTEPNYALTGLIALGVLLVLLAWRSARQDRAEMAEEEEDVEWVHRHGREGLALVFAPPSDRETLFRKGGREYTAEAGGRVETLIDDRVRRMLEKARNPYLRISPDELRGIAETRTARYGMFARYASSLLLLLAVLGTFAGVKTALPGLIDAVSRTGAAGRGTADITAPLQAVSDAFGGNALALVGAIAVGLMAQGLSMGRRNLLERLELVSTEFLYDALHGGSTDPLTEAVRELRDTAGSVRDTGRAIEGLEAGMNALAESFREAFDRLNQRLVEVAEQQDRNLHERTGSELREMQRRVADLAESVEGVTRAYHGIVDTVQERAHESRQSIDLLRQSAMSLHQALQSLGAYQASADRTAAGVRDTLAALQEGSDIVVERMEAVAASVERAQPAIDTVEVLLHQVSERMSTVDERASAAWTHAAETANAGLQEALDRMQSRMTREHSFAAPMTEHEAPKSDSEAHALLRRIASTLEEDRAPSSWQLAVAQGAGTLAALALGYGLFLAGRALLALLLRLGG